MRCVCVCGLLVRLGEFYRTENPRRTLNTIPKNYPAAATQMHKRGTNESDSQRHDKDDKHMLSHIENGLGRARDERRVAA